MSENSSDHSPVRALQWSVAALALVGIPAAVGVTFPEAFLRRPLRTAAAIAIYEISVLALAFVTKVWNRLQSRWAETVADAIADMVETSVSVFKIPQYCQQVVHRHKAFDVKGLGTQGIHTLQMEQVFVDLSIVPQPAHSASTDLLGQRGIIANRRYSIEDLLRNLELPFQSLVIIGPPGSGKTTLLKHVTLTLALKKISKKYHRIPVLLFLREHAEMIRASPSVGLMEVIQSSLPHLNYSGSSRWIRLKIKRGKCVVMLDGLDEIADATTRKLVASWIDRQIQQHALTRFVVTSRPFGYKANPLERVSVFEVRPFNGPQIRQFVRNWYLANEIMASGGKSDPGVRMAASTGAKDLLVRLERTWDLAELAVNPLLLTMIATVHRFRSSLPGRRVALYSEMCDVFLGNRQRAKGIEMGDLDLDPRQKRRVLEPLAYEMMNRKTREVGRAEALKIIQGTLAVITSKVNPEQFLSHIENFSGVLLERENAVYSFAHLTFQEFLSAVHIRSHQLEDDVIRHINDSWWHEVLRLYCAEGDATGIIRACLSSNSPTIEL